MVYLVKARRGSGGRGLLVELGETSATSSLGAVDVTLSVGDHGVLEGGEVEGGEAEAIILVELGLLLLAITLRTRKLSAAYKLVMARWGMCVIRLLIVCYDFMLVVTQILCRD